MLLVRRNTRIMKTRKNFEKKISREKDCFSLVDWNDKGDIENDWFSFDFTLEEIKTLKKHQVGKEF